MQRTRCNVALVLTLMGSWAGCSTPGSDPIVTRDVGTAELAHVVAFWWTDEAPADTSERLVELYHGRVAEEVPGVLDLWIGPPQPSERDVVDASFDLMCALRFESAEAESAWQIHPVHDVLRTEFGPFIERVQVYDFRLR
jgi:hypothetical protein